MWAVSAATLPIPTVLPWLVGDQIKEEDSTQCCADSPVSHSQRQNSEVADSRHIVIAVDAPLPAMLLALAIQATRPLVINSGAHLPYGAGGDTSCAAPASTGSRFPF